MGSVNRFPVLLPHFTQSKVLKGDIALSYSQREKWSWARKRVFEVEWEWNLQFCPSTMLPDFPKMDADSPKNVVFK